MFWQEDRPRSAYPVPDQIIDLMVSIRCRALPVDHIHALSTALSEHLPWLPGDARAGVQAIHGAGSQNGWERPTHGADQELILSRRTKLWLRLPKERVTEALRALAGLTLDVAGYPLTLGEAKTRPLATDPVLLARYVDCGAWEDEPGFLGWAVQELASVGVRVRKALCGRTLTLGTPAGPLRVRSLMVADLPPAEAVQLQERGLGPHRHLGCGIFIPHKGIDAVHHIRDD